MLCFLEILGDVLYLFTIEARVPFFTLDAELNQSGSSWPMNRPAEERYEKEQQITLLCKRGNSIQRMSKVQDTVKYIPSSTNGPISQSISSVFCGEFLWCCRCLYYRGLNKFLTLAAELNQRGSSWPMNRMAKETYEREWPIRLLYEGITRSTTLQSISKPKGSWRIIYCSFHLRKLVLKKR